jgi:hypothetical protein
MDPNEKLATDFRAERSIEFVPVSFDQKIGMAANVLAGDLPVNGVRRLPAGDTSGWHIWAGGKIPNDDHFFEPMHVDHLVELCPDLMRYLGLPPGWRFQVAPDHEDVWFDPALLVE